MAYENFRQRIVDLQGYVEQFNVEFLDRDDFKKFADDLVGKAGFWNNLCITGYCARAYAINLPLLRFQKD